MSMIYKGREISQQEYFDIVDEEQRQKLQLSDDIDKFRNKPAGIPFQVPTSSSGFTEIPVLEFLEGLPLTNLVFVAVAGLHPAKIQVVPHGGFVTTDSQPQRVTIRLTEDGRVNYIRQEVKVLYSYGALVDGVLRRYGRTMNEALRSQRVEDIVRSAIRRAPDYGVDYKDSADASTVVRNGYDLEFLHASDYIDQARVRGGIRLADCDPPLTSAYAHLAVPVLNFLYGLPCTNLVVAYLASLEPRLLRVVTPGETITDDVARNRATVYLDADNRVDRIMFELGLLCTKGNEFMAALRAQRKAVGLPLGGCP